MKPTQGEIKMNEFEQHLIDSPEHMEIFNDDNAELLKDISDRFQKFTDDGDHTFRYLLTTALTAIVTKELETSGNLIRAAIQKDHGCTVMTQPPDDEWWS